MHHPVSEVVRKSLSGFLDNLFGFFEGLKQTLAPVAKPHGAPLPPPPALRAATLAVARAESLGGRFMLVSDFRTGSQRPARCPRP